MDNELNDVFNDMQNKNLVTIKKPTAFTMQEKIALLCDAGFRALHPDLGKYPLHMLTTLPEKYDILNLYEGRN